MRGRGSADPYPDQHLVERSDSHALALKGIVAHTLSDCATVPTHHQPTDTTNAIRSLAQPIRALANDRKHPARTSGGRPTAQ